MVQSVRNKEKQRPAAANTGTSEDQVPFTPFEVNSRTEQDYRNGITHGNLPDRAKLAKLIDAEQRNAQYKDDDAEFV